MTAPEPAPGGRGSSPAGDVAAWIGRASVRPVSWRTPTPALTPQHRHSPGHRGQLDETARRLSHEELVVAQLLVTEGHSVRSLATCDRPTADLAVCGRETEIKSLNPGATSRTVTNALRRAKDQGVDVIVDARQSGLLPLAAERGVADFAARADQGRVARVRVIGSGFDRSYPRHDLDRMGRRSGGPHCQPGAGGVS